MKVKKSLVNLVKKAHKENDLLWKFISRCSWLTSRKIGKMGEEKIEGVFCYKTRIKINKQNKIHISRGTVLDRCVISIVGKNSSLVIGSNCRLTNVHITLFGNNAKCYIGNNVVFNSTKSKGVVINVSENHQVSIGDNSLFSKDIEIYTTDFHEIYNSNGDVINQDANVYIGKNVWVGMHTLFLKGSYIPDGCVIGAGSLVSKAFDEENCIYLGRPARAIKTDIHWKK